MFWKILFLCLQSGSQWQSLPCWRSACTAMRMSVYSVPATCVWMVCGWPVGVRNMKNKAKQMVKDVLHVLNYSSKPCCYWGAKAFKDKLIDSVNPCVRCVFQSCEDWLRQGQAYGQQEAVVGRAVHGSLRFLRWESLPQGCKHCGLSTWDLVPWGSLIK